MGTGMFSDRRAAGELLASALSGSISGPVLVLGIARGGLVVASEVARLLGSELDVILVRKIGVPNNPELATAAVSEDGEIVMEEHVAILYGVDREYIEQEARREMETIRRRAEMYRGGGALPDMRGKTVVLVDDGIATGTTMLAAVKTVSKRGAERIVVATPVAPAEVVEKMKKAADQVVVILVPEEFFAIGEFYRDFSQVSDEEVVEILRSRRGGGDAA